MARGSALVDLGDPIGTAVRLVRRDLGRFFELVERVGDGRIDGKLGYEEAEKRLGRLLLHPECCDTTLVTLSPASWR